MIDIATLRAMAEAGASVDVILAAVEAELRAEGVRVQARKAKDAERQRRWRERHVSHTESQSVTVTNGDKEVSLTSLLSSSVSTTKNTESKEEKKKVRARKSLLPDDWKPKPAHFSKAKSLGKPETFVLEKADDLRDWARSKDVMRADWDATFNGFLRRDAKQNSAFNGHAPRPGSKDDTRERTVNALRALDPIPHIDDFGGSKGPSAEIPRLLPFAKPA